VPFIGIDIGTTYIKGAVLDLDRKRLTGVRRIPAPGPIPCQSPLYHEVSPNRMIGSAARLLKELLSYAPESNGIVMCSQMHGMVLLDRLGRVRSNCVTWLDQRALETHPSGEGSYFEMLLKRVSPQSLSEAGNELCPSRPISFLFWLAERNQLPTDVIPVSLAEFVVSTLCESAPAIEFTNASGYGALNLGTMSWHQEIIENLGLDCLNWPKLCNCGEITGYFPYRGNRIPMYSPIGDYQCALLGSLLREDELSLNIATGAQVSRLTRGLELGEYQTRPYFSGKFLNTFTHPPGGRSLDLILDLLSELALFQGLKLNDPWNFIQSAAQAVQATDLSVDLDFFSSAGNRRGRISSIGSNNLKIGHIFRAAFLNMAESFYECATKLWPEQAWKNLLFSGGVATKLEVLRKAIQAQFNAPFRIAPIEEDTLNGLLLLARMIARPGNSYGKLNDEVLE